MAPHHGIEAGRKFTDEIKVLAASVPVLYRVPPQSYPRCAFI
jgi:hypothetical protein